ncbi:MAG: hypothetical protein PUH85_02680 [Firmicutes bacterium]|nr:hypothetical protein [Bacillota bacterium]
MPDKEINNELLTEIIVYSYKQFKDRRDNPTMTKDKVISNIAKHMKEVLKNENRED